MASFWKGYLKLSLVTCPVAMLTTVSESEKIRFHTLNRKTGNRLQRRYVDAVTGKPVRDDDAVKGYPRGDDDYVMIEDEELDSVALDSTRTIDIDCFVPADAIGWIWYDVPHFMVPDDKVGAEAFAVIRDAMRSTKTVAMSRVVLYRRERAIMLEPRDNGIVVWTLRYGDEVRPEDEYFGASTERKPEPASRKTVDALIVRARRDWSADWLRDPVQDRLTEIIAAKRKTGRRKATTPKQKSAEIVDLTEALRKSLTS